MMNRISLVFVAGLALWVQVGQTSAQTDPARYVNVELVAVDPSRRVVVIKDSRGAQRTLQMDDLLAGAGGMKTGDRVTLTVRGTGANQRVSAISRATIRPASVVVAATSQPPSVSSTPERAGAQAREGFARQVATLSRDAQSTDGMWASFVTSCGVKPVSANGGREWFGLWDGRVQADYSNGTCRDLFNQIVTSGEVIKKGMASAEETVRGALTPGEIRDIRKLSLMDWDGWSLPVPPKREP